MGEKYGDLDLTVIRENAGDHGFGMTSRELLKEDADSTVVYAISTFSTTDLRRVLAGEIDFYELASAEFAKRGQNIHGGWIGFHDAQKIHLARIDVRNAEATGKK